MSDAAKRYLNKKDVEEMQRKYLPACPYCGADTVRFLTRHGSFKVAKCEKCGCRFQYGGER